LLSHGPIQTESSVFVFLSGLAPNPVSGAARGLRRPLHADVGRFYRFFNKY